MIALRDVLLASVRRRAHRSAPMRTLAHAGVAGASAVHAHRRQRTTSGRPESSWHCCAALVVLCDRRVWRTASSGGTSARTWSQTCSPTPPSTRARPRDDGGVEETPLRRLPLRRRQCSPALGGCRSPAPRPPWAVFGRQLEQLVQSAAASACAARETPAEVGAAPTARSSCAPRARRCAAHSRTHRRRAESELVERAGGRTRALSRKE